MTDVRACWLSQSQLQSNSTTTTSPPNSSSWGSNATILTVSPTISVYIPYQVCRPENCPPSVATCDTKTNTCVPIAGSGWTRLTTWPQATVTNYCTLTTTGCQGVTQIQTPYTTATTVGKNLGYPLCASDNSVTCVGIVASPAAMVGNSQEATDPSTGTFVKNWGMGLTEASGVCYKLVGPGGATVIVATTDRCGGYCTCSAQSSKAECGPCVNAADLAPGCPCAGTVGTEYSSCCGLDKYCPGNAKVDAECDWCAAQAHPHFDLDTDTFNAVCGSQAGDGSCILASAHPIQCMTPLAWPPGSGSSGGGGGGGGVTCGTDAWDCSSGGNDPTNQPKIPGTSCCCNWGKTPTTGTNCS